MPAARCTAWAGGAPHAHWQAEVLGPRELAACQPPHPPLCVQAGQQPTLHHPLSRTAPLVQAAPVLRELRALVGSQLATLERMAQLKGVLQHVRSGLPLPRPRLRARRYTVEWLDLRVLD